MIENYTIGSKRRDMITTIEIGYSAKTGNHLSFIPCISDLIKLSENDIEIEFKNFHAIIDDIKSLVLKHKRDK